MTRSATRPARLDVLDGVRGIALALVILSHGWTLWPTESITAHSALSPWFRSGNLAVSVFFVVGSFLTTRALLRSLQSPNGLRPGLAACRRLLRLGGQTWLLLLVVLLVTAMDTTDTYPRTATRESVLHAATFTWNWYVHDNPLEARPDIGHLWYLAVDLQMFLIVVATVWLLRRHPNWLIVSLLTMLVALWAWRVDIYSYDEFGALMRTWARGNSPVAGALAAVVATRLKGDQPWATWAGGVSALFLIPLVYLTDETDGYMSWPGMALDLTLALFVVAVTMRTPTGLLHSTLGSRPLAFLGRHSLSLYLWHYPIFWFVARHTSEWSWPARTLCAFFVVALAAWASELIVEGKVRRALAANWWQDAARTGLLPYASKRVAEYSRQLIGRPPTDSNHLRTSAPPEPK